MTDTRILELLNDDIDCCNTLLDILEREFAALNERQLEQLQRLLDSKQPLLIQLNQNAGLRSKHLQQLGLSADRQGFQAFAEASSLAEQLLASHEQLSQLIEACQAANLRNGRLIRANQITVDSALNIIRGNSGPSLYDKTGSTAAHSSRRTFTSV